MAVVDLGQNHGTADGTAPVRLPSTGAIGLPALLKFVGKKPAESKTLLRSMKKASPCSLLVPGRML